MLLRPLRLAVVPVLAAVALAGCGSSSEDSAAPATPSVTTTVTATASPDAEASGEALPTVTPSTAPSAPSTQATVPSAPIDLDETIRDKGLGHTIAVEQVVRSFPAPASAHGLVDQGDELVLVKVKVTAGRKYYASVGPDDFVFGVAGSSEVGTALTSGEVATAMTKAGDPPLGDVDAGKTAEGWVAGVVRPAGSAQAYVGYRRLAYHVAGGGSIPAKTWKVTLPQG